MKFSDLRLRARALFTPGNVERELDDELAFQIECETRKLMAGGLGAAEARRRALARFGPVPLAADQCRDERGISFFETLGRDLSFALRTFRRAPLVALTVVSTIALGLAKRMFDVATTLTLDEFMDLEGSMLPLAVQAEDFKEGTRAFKEKRAASFTGH